MAVAHSIFTLDGGFQLFFADFDVSVIVVPLKVAIGLMKMIFGCFKKNSGVILDVHLPVLTH